MRVRHKRHEIFCSVRIKETSIMGADNIHDYALNFGGATINDMLKVLIHVFFFI